MWTERDNRLVREFRFKDFQEAFTFMTRVAFLAESHAHHPTMVNTFSYVRIELHTHDAGGVVTRKDHELAQDIDDCCSRWRVPGCFDRWMLSMKKGTLLGAFFCMLAG